MDIEYVDIVTVIFNVNLYYPETLVNTFLYGQVMGGIVILASWEKHFIRVRDNLSQYPRILYPLL